VGGNRLSRDGPRPLPRDPLQQKLKVAAVDPVALHDEADQGICLSSATAILMTDLRGFSALSRGLSAQELIAFLGDYQSPRSSELRGESSTGTLRDAARK
jgi:class 3 adenylate cyclase